MTPTSPSVTIAIPTYNGIQFIGAILKAISAQTFDGAVDVLIIDSGSTDGTLEAIASYPDVRLHRIPNSEFGHGKTRGLAARMAKGDIVVYLTHDAVPANDLWLAELVAPMVDDPRIAAVLGKQIARGSAPPILKYDIDRVFTRLGPDWGVTVIYDTGRPMTRAEREAAGFYSDVNCAARKSVLTGPVPYRDVAYAEDQVFGRDLFDKGLRKAYAPRAVVEHSNQVTVRTFGRRISDEILGLRGIGSEIPPLSRLGALNQWVKWSTADTARILMDRGLSPWKKCRWLLANPLYHAVKWSAYRRASRAKLTDARH